MTKHTKLRLIVKKTLSGPCCKTYLFRPTLKFRDTLYKMNEGPSCELGSTDCLFYTNWVAPGQKLSLHKSIDPCLNPFEIRSHIAFQIILVLLFTHFYVSTRNSCFILILGVSQRFIFSFNRNYVTQVLVMAFILEALRHL